MTRDLFGLMEDPGGGLEGLKADVARVNGSARRARLGDDQVRRAEANLNRLLVDVALIVEAARRFPDRTEEELAKILAMEDQSLPGRGREFFLAKIRRRLPILVKRGLLMAMPPAAASLDRALRWRAIEPDRP